MQLLGAGLVGLVVFLSYLAFDQFLANRRRKDSLRIRIAADGTRITEDSEGSIGLDKELSMRAKTLAGILRMMGVNVEEATRKLEVRFARAGNPSPDAPIFYLFFQRVVSIVLLMLALTFVATPADGTRKILFIVMGLFIGFIAVFGAYFFLQNAISKRQSLLIKAFPDTLDLLLICVESGLALDASLNRVCGELGRAFPEMTQELNRTRLELALLNDRTKALSNLAERTDLLAFRSLTATLIQSERFGTSLTDTLRVLSEDFRLQRLAKAEEKAARLPVLLTIPLVFLLMPAFMLIILGPAIISFMRDGSALTGG
ncbi:MAG: type II secretion system F family protein [Alphaproteobacteria bacterium]|nr:type II secretion system F family protein [Alphaproteobacteria bacterium]